MESVVSELMVMMPLLCLLLFIWQEKWQFLNLDPFSLRCHKVLYIYICIISCILIRDYLHSVFLRVDHFIYRPSRIEQDTTPHLTTPPNIVQQKRSNGGEKLRILWLGLGNGSKEKVGGLQHPSQNSETMRVRRYIFLELRFKMNRMASLNPAKYLFDPSYSYLYSQSQLFC